MRHSLRVMTHAALCCTAGVGARVDQTRGATTIGCRQSHPVRVRPSLRLVETHAFEDDDRKYASEKALSSETRGRE
jgi:hypothetical protein